MNEVVDRAAVVAAIVGSMLKAARGRGLKVQRGGPTARAIELLDFLSLRWWRSYQAWIRWASWWAGFSLFWRGVSTRRLRSREMSFSISEESAAHRRVNCEGCLIQRSANGHHFVQAIAAMHSSETRGQYQVANVAMVLSHPPRRTHP